MNTVLDVVIVLITSILAVAGVLLILLRLGAFGKNTR